MFCVFSFFPQFQSPEREDINQPNQNVSKQPNQNISNLGNWNITKQQPAKWKATTSRIETQLEPTKSKHRKKSNNQPNRSISKRCWSRPTKIEASTGIETLKPADQNRSIGARRPKSKHQKQTIASQPQQSKWKHCQQTNRIKTYWFWWWRRNEKNRFCCTENLSILFACSVCCVGPW